MHHKDMDRAQQSVFTHVQKDRRGRCGQEDLHAYVHTNLAETQWLPDYSRTNQYAVSHFTDWMIHGLVSPRIIIIILLLDDINSASSCGKAICQSSLRSSM